jgi:serine protease Do
MRNTITIIGTVIIIANLAIGQAPPAPPAPPAPATQATPETPSVRPPKPPKAPRAPRAMGGSYLGVDTRDVTPERMGALKLKNDNGVEILMVDQDAPAGKAGLKEHDVIISFNGKPVQDQEQLRSMIRSTAPGTKVNLGISRDGQPMNVTAEVADRQSMWSGRVIRIPRIEIPPMPEIDVPPFSMLQFSRRNGLMVENLTKQLGEFFGAKEGRGVLIRSVEKNSPAESAGFHAGDVIIRVGSEPVENMADWNQLMRSQQAGKVPVTVIREKHEQTFTLNMPERRGNSSRSGQVGFGDDDDVRIEIADIGPQVREQMEKARVEMEKAFKDHDLQKEMAQMQKEMAKSAKINQKEIQKQMEKAHKQMQEAMKELEKQNITIHIDDDEEK